MAFGALFIGITMALAEPNEGTVPPTGIPEPSIASSLPANGDPQGVRAALAGRGITYKVNYGAEVFGVADGGIRRGSKYTGQLEGIVNVDFSRLMGWHGLTFLAHAYQLHGRGISASHLGVFDPVTNYEATPSTRLFELWLEQAMFNDKLSIRFGQMRVDYEGEFVNSQTAGLFISASFGWPAFLGANLPSGGVTYPIISPGIRLKAAPTTNSTFLLGVYNDDPAGPCAGDPQVCNNDGLKFRLQDDPFVIAEVQYKYGDNKVDNGLNGMVKVGGFVDLGKFGDKRFSNDGLSLADPLSNGIARIYHENYGLYAVIDQQVYRSPTAQNGDAGIYTFGRIAGLPSTRNVVDFSFDIGIKFNGLSASRPNDEFGFAFVHNRVSNRLSDLDLDTMRFGGSSIPVRSTESLAEFTYKAQIIPGLIIQPDVQYVWRPGGNASDPKEPTRSVENAWVFGLRSVINY